ncbi:MAG: 30S ribosomal protein S17 [Candidatus Omnitrophica bacterium]|nr:30S ribosomal protein S17 [Candidatus Omnitrophota bacterium]MBI3021379.1 30S ribosomal protein S17 [Candidatus Omnitrophota bacterium]MBI3083156.1 30S ribosomal protein S17 [Candidatus Omnitrophota bacterium]
MTSARGHRKAKIGVVVSNKMAKTIVVRIGRFIRHPRYGRVIKRASTFKAHDEAGRAAVGDVVKIMETRPLSREKRWRLVEILKRASTAPPVPGEESEPVLQKPKAGVPEQASEPQRTEQVVG